MSTTTVTANQGGYFANTPGCKIYNDHSPALRDVELDLLPIADQARVDEGIAYEALIGARWAETLKATELPGHIVKLATGTKDFDDEVRAVADALQAENISIVWIPEMDRSSLVARNRWAALTHGAMEAGAQFIWNARLKSADGRSSEPDWLSFAGTDANGKALYHPGDVKNAAVMTASKTKPKEWLVGSMAAPLAGDATYTTLLGSGTAKKKYALQLAHYHRHLQSLGYGVDDDDALGAILDNDANVVWWDLNMGFLHDNGNGGPRKRTPALRVYEDSWAERQGIVAHAQHRKQHPLGVPRLRAECSSCVWRTWCRDQMANNDELTLLRGVTTSKVQVHLDAGVTTQMELAKVDWKTARLLAEEVDAVRFIDAASELDPDQPVRDANVVGANPDLLAELGLVTAADVLRLNRDDAVRYSGLKAKYLPGHIDQARVTKAGKVYLNRDTDKLVVPTFDIEIDIDMENDPQGIIYLWGTRVDAVTSAARKFLSDEGIENGAYIPFSTFVDGDDTGEAQAFADMWAFVARLILNGAEQGLSVGAWCYTDAEDRCMRHLAKKHAGFAGMPSVDEVNDFIDSEHWVDLYKVINTQTMWPTENLSLKTTAKWARHSWRAEDAGGDASTVWYQIAVKDDDPSVRAEYRNMLLEYNEDDVVATYVLRGWLRRLMRARKPENRLPSVATLERRFRRVPAAQAVAVAN